MSAWSYTNPPEWFPTAVAADMGWKNPDTEELLVAISNFAAKNGDVVVVPSIVGVTANNEALVTGDSLIVVVEFSEAVTVMGTPSIVLNVGAETRTLSFDATTSDSTHVAFSYTVAEEDSAVAGDVIVGTEIDLTNGSIYDVLPSGGMQKILPPVSFAAPVTDLVSLN